METINHNGIELTLIQLPYLAGTQNEPVYEAYAVDEDDNDYLVTWELIKPLRELFARGCDESDICDWTKYTVEAI